MFHPTAFSLSTVVMLFASASVDGQPPLIAGPLACQEEPKPVPKHASEAKSPKQKSATKRKRKEPFEEHLAQLKKLSKRVNGVLLSATAEAKNDSIEIKWSLDYDGPRPPLIIQKPMYPGNTWYATKIHILVRGAKSEVRAVQFTAPYGPGLPPPLTKEDYVTVEKGKSTSGNMSLAVAEVKARLVKEFPALAGAMPPKEVFIQLEHSPTQRGEQFTVDAWTGRLHSLPSKVTLKKW